MTSIGNGNDNSPASSRFSLQILHRIRLLGRIKRSSCLPNYDSMCLAPVTSTIFQPSSNSRACCFVSALILRYTIPMKIELCDALLVFLISF